MTRVSILALAALALASCDQVEPRFDAPFDAGETDKIGIRYARVEVATVSLPVYAQGEDIHVRDETGAIVPLGPLWTDTPDRAVTLEIARRLDALTGRLVAPEPWPFREFPDVKVDVRLDTFLATEAGAFLIAGQVFVAPEEDGTDRALTFDITADPRGDAGAASIAMARAAAMSDLAEFIARKGLR